MHLQFLLPCSALFPLVGDCAASVRLVWDVLHMVQGQHSLHFCWEINLVLTSGDKERAHAASYSLRVLLQRNFSKQMWQHCCHGRWKDKPLVLFKSAFCKVNFICFSFPDGAKLLCPGQGMVPWFWMLLKPWWVFLNSGAPSALGQVEPLGLIFPAVSVLGLHMPNITCLCCHQSLQEKLFPCWGGNAWKGAFYIPMTHSTQPLWKFSCWEQHVLVAHKDSLHPAVACQGQLLGDHWPASLAGDELFVRLDTVLAEERQCMGWAVPDGEGECNTLGRWSYFFASRIIVNSCF